MCFHGPVGEEEVMKINMENAQKKDYTVEDLRKMPENVRAELIDGQIYYFSAPKLIHQDLVIELAFKLKQYVNEKHGDCKVYVAPVDVCLDCDDKTMLEPDIIVVCDKEKLHEDACYGAPDMVIEIASKSTKKRDYGIKMLKYRKAGVKEYWVADPDSRTVLVYWFKDESINCLYTFDDEITLNLFPEVQVRISDWTQEA